MTFNKDMKHKTPDLSFLIYQYVWSAFVFGSAALMVTIIPFIFIFNTPNINPLWVGFSTVASWTLSVLGYMIAFGLLQEAWYIWKLHRLKKSMIIDTDSNTDNNQEVKDGITLKTTEDDLSLI